VKISVSLPDEDLEFLDAYAAEHKYPSRSAALRHALTLLRAGELAPAYEDAWRGWPGAEAGAWEATAADGMRS
jgi:Arc/MetJ-type ribon-helix-helix transcriptional regulator